MTKKHVLPLLLALLFCLELCPVPDAQAAGPVQIASAEDLEYFVHQVDFEDQKDLDAILTADIDLAGRDWIPIALGSHGTPYIGTFDGNGHKISNLCSEWHGFMGQLGTGGTIRDLTLENICLTNGSYTLVETCGGTVSNCTVSGTMSVSSGSYEIGGLVSKVAGGSITGCRSSIHMSYDARSNAAYYHLGGIVGCVGGTDAGMGIVDRCIFDGSIQVSGQVPHCNGEIGGIAGDAGMYGIVLNCANHGNISADVSAASPGNVVMIGGILGWTMHGMATNCLNTGNITVTTRGVELRCSGLGLAAMHGDGPPCATNSYTTGKVTRSTDSATIIGTLDGKGPMMQSTYFLEGADFNSGETVTFTQAELMDGTLTGQLNQGLEDETASLRRFVDSFNQTTNGSAPYWELCAWVQGPSGPELSGSAAPASQTPSAIRFADVPESQFYYEPVLWAVQQGIAGGTGPSTFSPNQTCTQADILTFLWRAAGQPDPWSILNPFPSVTESDYFYNPLLWAWESGVLIDVSFDAASFDPKAPCTRISAVFYIWKFVNCPAASEWSLCFQDIDSYDPQSMAVMWAAEAGVTGGTGEGLFSPDRTCTRGEIITFFYRAFHA